VSVLIAGLTSTFQTPATCISQWQNNITRSSAGLPTFDYTTACVSFSRLVTAARSLSNDTTVDALRSVAKLVHSQLPGAEP